MVANRDRIELFLDLKDRLSSDGDPSSISSPMLFAYSTLAGNFCADLIYYESRSASPSTRRIHPMIDFSKSPTTISDAAWRDSIQRYAGIFWKRAATTGPGGEEQILVDMINESIKGLSRPSSTDTPNLLLMVCTAMGSSLEAISY